MDILSRLIKFRDFTELSNSQFADKAGIPRPTLSQFLNGRNKRLSDDLAMKLHVAYPQLNMLWLMFGEGDMLVDPNIKISEGKNNGFGSVLSMEHVDNQKKQDKNNVIGGLFDDEPIRAEDIKKSTNDSAAHKNDPNHELREPIVSAFRSNPSKTVQYVMVFYSDSSFEVFRPS